MFNAWTDSPSYQRNEQALMLKDHVAHPRIRTTIDRDDSSKSQPPNGQYSLPPALRDAVTVAENRD